MCVLNSSTQTIKRRISSPSLSIVHGLNPSVRPLVLVQSLESLVWCVFHLVILCYFVCGSQTSFYWLLITLSIFLLLLHYCFWSIFLSQKYHIKSRKSKVWLTMLSLVSKLVLPCTFVLMALYIYERSLFLCTLITMEELLKFMWLL